jgi:hypothetical protein
LTDIAAFGDAFELLRRRGNPVRGQLRRRIGLTDAERMDSVLSVIGEQLAGCDEMSRLAGMLGFERPVDTMSNAIFPIIRELHRHEPYMAAPDDLYDQGDVAPGLAAEALDLHTQVGKRALKAFHTSAAKTIPEVAALPVADAVRGLGSLVFIHEGGQVDQRAVNTFLSGMKQYQDYHFAKSYGVPVELHEPLGKVLHDESDRLFQKRKWALNSF